MSLAGKVAIVTGAGRGIGAGIASHLGRSKAAVVVHYNGSQSKAAAVADAINEAGGEAITVQADLSSAECGIKIVKAAVDWKGRIDIIVNNAGVLYPVMTEEVNQQNIDKYFTEQFDCNVRAPVMLVTAALPHLQKGGRIVNLSSIAARDGDPAQGLYGASKAALELMTKNWAKELGLKYNVTVNAVNPGPVNTDMWVATSQDFKEMMARDFFPQTPSGSRVGEIDDIVQIVAFLCSENSRWINGSVVCGNGGVRPN